MGEKCDNMEGYINWEHPFPRISRYKRASDIKEGDSTEVRVYPQPYHIQWPSVLPAALNQ